MSMLSRWTIGAMASKKARASCAGLGGDRFGELGAGQRAGGDDRRVIGQRVDALADDGDVGMLLDRSRDFGGEGFAVDGERRAGGHAMRVGRAHDQRAERAHFLVEQADGIVLGIVGAEAVRADHLGEAVGFMRRRHVAAAAHFAEAHAQARLGELPGGFGSGEPAADDVDVEGHGVALSLRAKRSNPAAQMDCFVALIAMTIAMRIYTIGYEGTTVGEFLAALHKAGVERVIDVRALPLSRRPGFLQDGAQRRARRGGNRISPPQGARDARRRARGGAGRAAFGHGTDLCRPARAARGHGASRPRCWSWRRKSRARCCAWSASPRIAIARLLLKTVAADAEIIDLFA